jgi:hypothetical protein
MSSRSLIATQGTFRSKARPFQNYATYGPSQVLNYATGAVTSTFDASGQMLVRDFLEQIDYTVSPKASRRKSNICRHLKSNTYYHGDPGSPTRVNENNQTAAYSCCYLAKDSPGAHSIAVGYAKTALGGYFEQGFLQHEGQTLINDGAWKLRPDLTTVSVPNFVIEIGQIRELFQLWKKNLGIAKNLAGADLNYHFGWKPTMGDLKNVLDAIVNLSNEVTRFEKALNQLFHRSASVYSDSQSASGNPLLPGFSTRWLPWNASIKRSVTAHVVWAPQPLQVIGALDKVLRSLIDSLGFELNPRIIWDALPFTFILDWFFGFGSFLERFKVDALELPIVYVDSYLQYKEELVIDSQIVQSVSTQNPVYRSGGMTTQINYFERMPILPDYPTLRDIGWKKPTINQARLLVSLATVLAKR